MKTRRRDPRAIDYDHYMLIDVRMNAVVYGTDDKERKTAKNGDEPPAPRNGLRNGNPSGPPFGPSWPGRRCGAKTRHRRPCLNPAMRNRGRCRMHGGASTGPRTPEGLERSRRARWLHGERSAETITRNRLYRRIKRLLGLGPREVALAEKLLSLIVFKDDAG